MFVVLCLGLVAESCYFLVHELIRGWSKEDFKRGVEQFEDLVLNVVAVGFLGDWMIFKVLFTLVFNLHSEDMEWSMLKIVTLKGYAALCFLWGKRKREK